MQRDALDSCSCSFEFCLRIERTQNKRGEGWDIDVSFTFIQDMRKNAKSNYLRPRKTIMRCVQWTEEEMDEELDVHQWPPGAEAQNCTCCVPVAVLRCRQPITAKIVACTQPRKECSGKWRGRTEKFCEAIIVDQVIDQRRHAPRSGFGEDLPISFGILRGFCDKLITWWQLDMAGNHASDQASLQLGGNKEAGHIRSGKSNEKEGFASLG